jgi:hypothetical protein
MIKITKRSEFPKCVQKFKELKGICIGGCVDKDVSFTNDDCWAHSHSNSYDKYTGWICLHYKYQLKHKLLLLHEVAHLIANKQKNTHHHGTRWKQAVSYIGGTYKAYTYQYKGEPQYHLDFTYRNK